MSTSFEEVAPMLKAMHKHLGKEGRVYARKVLEINAKELQAGRVVTLDSTHPNRCSIWFKGGECNCGSEILVKEA